MSRPDSTFRFSKMHGLGNDFMVLDQRGRQWTVDAADTRILSDRRTGVGFDQLVEIRDCWDADAQLSFRNADGSPSASCGNATRCIARILMNETGRATATIRTDRGKLHCRDAGDGMTAVNMGLPLFHWQDIPLSQELDTYSLPIDGNPVAVGMGNPHCVFFVDDVEEVVLEEVGPQIEQHSFFPERTNVEFVSVISEDSIRLRIWERGTGVTLASGSGSCAAGVAAARRGLTSKSIVVLVDGGKLKIDWQENGVWMTGPTAHIYDGEVQAGILGDTDDESND